jgi:hypothetical protein
MNRLLTVAMALAFAATFSATAAAQNYETPPVLKASEIWEGNLLEGPNHKVRDAVATSGFTNTYTIDSDFGVIYAQGDHLLLERVREIYAIAGIRATKETSAYTEALSSGVTGTVNGAKNLIKDPTGSVKGMAKGAARFLKSAGSRVTTTVEGNGSANELKQYTEAKRQIAGKYQVDPYTSNQIYQDEVASVATASTMGNLTFKVASYAIPGGVGVGLRGLKSADSLNEKLINSGPYDLRVQNKADLTAMSLSDELIDAFLDHPHFTPRHQTAIVLALKSLAGARNRGEYIRLALAARSTVYQPVPPPSNGSSFRSSSTTDPGPRSERVSFSHSPTISAPTFPSPPANSSSRAC